MAPPHPPEPGGLPAARNRIPRLRTVPGRIRALATIAILAVAGLFAVASIFLAEAADGLHVIGHGSGPQVVATGDLYFALSDMDAQVAGILLIGKQSDLGPGKQKALQTYNDRHAQATKAILQAADLARGDAAGRRTVQSVLDGLGEYERLVGQALKLDELQPHNAGPPSQQVIDLYDRATGLMKLKLLPQAYNLTLDNGTIVRRTYEAKRSSVLEGRLWVILAGLVALAVLAGLQLYLAAGFRRLLSPFLVSVTAGTLILLIACVMLFNGAADHLKRIKEDGFDSILALSRARAISNSLNADETRFLLDPGRSDTYAQVYLDKAQQILYVVGGTSLDKYYKGLGEDLGGYPGKVRFLGFYGSEARHVTLDGQGAAITAVLADWSKFQQDDKQVRALVQSNRRQEAIALRMGATGSLRDFGDYDLALVSLIKIHTTAFDRATSDGDGALRGWAWGLPIGAIVFAGLILAGVRPRLSEFR